MKRKEECISSRGRDGERGASYLAELEELERTSPELTLHLDFTIALTALGRIDEVVERLERDGL